MIECYLGHERYLLSLWAVGGAYEQWSTVSVYVQPSRPERIDFFKWYNFVRHCLEGINFCMIGVSRLNLLKRDVLGSFLWILFFSYFHHFTVELLLAVVCISQIAPDVNSGTFSLAYLHSLISLEQVQ